METDKWIDKLIDTMFDEEDLVKQKGGTLLYTVEETDDHAEWYLVYTDDARPYYEEEADEEEEDDYLWAEILLVTGGATSWNIDCTFDDDVAKLETCRTSLCAIHSRRSNMTSFCPRIGHRKSSASLWIIPRSRARAVMTSNPLRIRHISTWQ